VETLLSCVTWQHCVLVRRGFIVNTKSWQQNKKALLHDSTWLFDNKISSCLSVKWKFAFWLKQNRSSSTFEQIFHFYFPFISSSEWKKYTSLLYFSRNKGTLLHTLARKTKVSSYKHWREKYNCHICCDEFKTILTNGNCKLFLGLERKHKCETYTLLRLCLIKFLSTHIPLILVDYQGREWHRWGPMWLLYQSRKLHLALSEIVSLVYVLISFTQRLILTPR